LVRNRDFIHTPVAIDAPVRSSNRNIAIPFGMETLELRGYPMVQKSVMIRLAISIEYRRVTEGQTDILRQYSPRYA